MLCVIVQFNLCVTKLLRYDHVGYLLRRFSTAGKSCNKKFSLIGTACVTVRRVRQANFAFFSMQWKTSNSNAMFASREA